MNSDSEEDQEGVKAEGEVYSGEEVRKLNPLPSNDSWMCPLNSSISPLGFIIWSFNTLEALILCR